MPHWFLQNLLKISRAIFLSKIRRDYKYQMSCIIPGGGLGKLQGIKEEEYFLRKDHKLFQNMKEKLENTAPQELTNFSEETELQKANEKALSVKHKDLVEEAYFLNDHCDSLQILKEKFKNEHAEQA